jgi:hypothetical protein
VAGPSSTRRLGIGIAVPAAPTTGDENTAGAGAGFNSAAGLDPEPDRDGELSS